MSEEKQDWIFTFGVNDPLGKYYVVIHDTLSNARFRMEERFAQNWAMMYKTREEAGTEKYGLKEIVLK